MKSKIFNLFFFTFCSFCFGQEITVTYFDQFVYPKNVTIKNEYFADLLVNGGESIYYPIDTIEDEQQITSSMGGDGNVINKKITHKYYTINYKNKQKNNQVTKIMQGGVKYLISEEIQTLSWNITDQVKKIGEYNCRLATSKSNGVKIEAWYTEEIPISNGPAQYGGLPGLILEVKKGIKHILAKKVIFSTNKEFVTPPTKGKYLSREEYTSIMDKKRNSIGKSDTKTKVESTGNGTKTTTTKTSIIKTDYKNK